MFGTNNIIESVFDVLDDSSLYSEVMLSKGYVGISNLHIPRHKTNKTTGTCVAVSLLPPS